MSLLRRAGSVVRRPRRRGAPGLLLSVSLSSFACAAGDEPITPAAPPFTLPVADNPEAFMSVWGRGADDVWVVGADLGDGPVVLRYDGAAWTRLVTGSRGDLWWVFGIGDAVYLGGAEGVILRYRAGAFEQMATPGLATVYGIWGGAPDDLWAVGGASSTIGFAWRYDGDRWREANMPAGSADVAGFFKVSGRSVDDVWIVGVTGVTVHWDGDTATLVQAGNETLFTVHAHAAGALAVGGTGSGVVLENLGAGWIDRGPVDASSLFGVCRAADFDVVVGGNGAVLMRSGGPWSRVETPLVGHETLHAAWIDPSGGVWAVGGSLSEPPLEGGVVLHRAPQHMQPQ